MDSNILIRSLAFFGEARGVLCTLLGRERSERGPLTGEGGKGNRRARDPTEKSVCEPSRAGETSVPVEREVRRLRILPAAEMGSVRSEMAVRGANPRAPVLREGHAVKAGCVDGPGAGEAGGDGELRERLWFARASSCDKTP